MNSRRKVTIHTDGYCEPNPGRGGYGIVLVHGEVRKELHGGFLLTTNNRMELIAVILALEALKFPCEVELFSDSRYVVDILCAGRLAQWHQRRLARAEATDTSYKNSDLWERMIPLVERHSVTAHWVRGHASDAENERCDALALQGASLPDLPEDTGYIPTSSAKPASWHGSAREKKAEKVKVTAEGQPCRKCHTPVVKQTPRKKAPGKTTYSYAYYFFCPSCRAMYFVDEARVYPGGAGNDSTGSAPV